MKKHIFTLPVLFLLAISLFGCATSITLSVERPADFDMQGASEIAVLPFRYYSFESGSIARYIRTELTDKLVDANYFTVKSSNAVENAIMEGRRIPTDAFISGRISSFRSNIERHRVDKTVKGEKIKVTEFSKRVSFTVEYEIIDAKTNAILGSDSYYVSNSSSNYSRRYNLPSALSITEYSLNSLASKIVRQVQPHYEYKTIKLLSDKTKDPEMKRAHELAKAGQTAEAQKLFEQLYRDFHYFEAAYNAAIIYEAQGKYEIAKEKMTNLYSTYPDDRIVRAINDIDYEIRERDRLLSQKVKREKHDNPSFSYDEYIKEYKKSSAQKKSEAEDDFEEDEDFEDDLEDL